MLIENYQQELIQSILTKYKEDGFIYTDIPSLSFYCSSSINEFSTFMYEPSFNLIIQGSKDVILGDIVYDYNPTHYILASIHIPTYVRMTKASPDKPFISLRLTFSIEDIFEVMKDMSHMPYKMQTKNTELGLYFGDINQPLLDSLVRLVRLSNEPHNIKFLAPLIIKEILYRVMSEQGGDFFRKYLIDGSIVQQIVKIIAKLKQDFTQTINMKELAKSFGISESTMYHNFHKTTMMSPLQFQKILRLEEAKRMLLLQNLNASDVAFAVGYESPSQFNKEFTRMFGMPPKTYAKAKQTYP